MNTHGQYETAQTEAHRKMHAPSARTAAGAPFFLFRARREAPPRGMSHGACPEYWWQYSSRCKISRATLRSRPVGALRPRAACALAQKRPRRRRCYYGRRSAASAAAGPTLETTLETREAELDLGVTVELGLDAPLARSQCRATPAQRYQFCFSAAPRRALPPRPWQSLSFYPPRPRQA